MAANSLQGNLTGSRTEGNLQVLMDVGLAGAVGISADELKKRMDSVIDLQAKVGEMTEQIQDMKEKLLNQAKEDDEMEPDEEEPGIALEDQLRIAEQSAKAIELLSSHLLCTVWQTCSKNTYGNEI